MNLLKGEVPLKVGDKEYTLKLTTNALCELENRLNKGVNEIIIAAASKEIPSLNTVRCLLFCACLEYHKEEVTSLEVAGEIIDEAGFKDAWTAVIKAIAACLPDTDKTSEQKKTSDQGK